MFFQKSHYHFLRYRLFYKHEDRFLLSCYLKGYYEVIFMKKIGIVTIVSGNYGNRLQNYALQTVLQNMGYDVNTIRRADSSILLIIKNYIHYLWHTNDSTQFFKFDKKIKWSKNSWDERSQLSILSNQYDYFVAGSDQIWNPYYTFTGTDLDFLTFVEDKRRIAYAASFGVSSLPIEKVAKYRECLCNFSKISTREDAGSDIVLSLTGKRVSVVLDPVLLLDANHWRKIEKKPRNMPKGAYTLVYSVESMSEELTAAVEEEKKYHQVLEISRLYEMGCSVGPAEFLYLIDHADKLLTDSFHGSAFSILFHTPFYIYRRDGHNMSSRMDTLLSTVELKDVSEFSRAVFDRSDMLLKKRRLESIDFLRGALEE